MQRLQNKVAIIDWKFAPKEEVTESLFEELFTLLVSSGFSGIRRSPIFA